MSLRGRRLQHIYRYAGGEHGSGCQK